MRRALHAHGNVDGNDLDQGDDPSGSVTFIDQPFIVSFSCPHFRIGDDYCLRLKTDCVPGRPGCVIGGKAVFAVPVEQRIREREEENRRKELARIWGAPPPEDGAKR